jgi:hypothetical protein
MSPPHRQLQLHESSRAGFPSRMTEGDPGDHEDTMLGTQGMGVRTPSAAAGAAATVGFARLVHMPNDAMLSMGSKSMTLAAGSPSTETRGLDVAVSVEGPMPNVHCISAPLHTISGVEISLFGPPRRVGNLDPLRLQNNGT